MANYRLNWRGFNEPPKDIQLPDGSFVSAVNIHKNTAGKNETIWHKPIYLGEETTFGDFWVDKPNAWSQSPTKNNNASKDVIVPTMQSNGGLACWYNAQLQRLCTNQSTNTSLSSELGRSIIVKNHCNLWRNVDFKFKEVSGQWRLSGWDEIDNYDSYCFGARNFASTEATDILNDKPISSCHNAFANSIGWGTCPLPVSKLNCKDYSGMFQNSEYTERTVSSWRDLGDFFKNRTPDSNLDDFLRNANWNQYDHEDKSGLWNINFRNTENMFRDIKALDVGFYIRMKFDLPEGNHQNMYRNLCNTFCWAHDSVNNCNLRGNCDNMFSFDYSDRAYARWDGDVEGWHFYPNTIFSNGFANAKSIELQNITVDDNCNFAYAFSNATGEFSTKYQLNFNMENSAYMFYNYLTYQGLGAKYGSWEGFSMASDNIDGMLLKANYNIQRANQGNHGLAYFTLNWQDRVPENVIERNALTSHQSFKFPFMNTEKITNVWKAVNGAVNSYMSAGTFYMSFSDGSTFTCSAYNEAPALRNGRNYLVESVLPPK